MGLDRRTFLQQAGLALFTWGATEVGISSGNNNNQLAILVKNYQQTLAQTTNRKLALLVGINRYSHNEHLQGCLTDVELQRELLVHRFGFNPQDIITLSDRQATRENIETAFVEHLSKQATADDVVVFHFSGYGGQIKMPLSDGNPIAEDRDTFKLVNSFVPVDGILSAKNDSISNSILQDTLLVLAQSLSTAKCTFVLDTSFNTTPRSKHGSFKVRSTDKTAAHPSNSELAFLEQLRADFAAKKLKPSKRLLSLPGVVLSASSNNQIAAERQWNGFSAGLFTQALTQHLWQITPSSKMQVALARTAETVEQIMGRQQQPALNNPDKSAIAYYLATPDALNATGVVSKVNNNNIEVKLLGLPAIILDCYGMHSCVNVIATDNSVTSAQLQLLSKEGLVGKTQLLQPKTTEQPQVGQLVRETVRILNHNLNLTLALDTDLQRIERVDATSALANIASVDSTVASGEKNADCHLGKVYRDNPANKVNDDDSDTTKPATFSYGLYTSGGILIGKTIGEEEEAIKIALDRLQPQFNNLLAAKWLELTNNEFSSGLQVDANLATGTAKQSVSFQRSTFLTQTEQPPAKRVTFNNSYGLESNNAVPILTKGSEIELTLANNSDRTLYAILLGIDSDSNIFTLYTPNQSKSTEAKGQLQNLAIAPQDQLVIPAAENSWKWKVSGSMGINTLYAIFSVQPLAQTLDALTNQQNFKLDQQQILNVIDPIVAINSLMQDLHTASSVSEKLLTNNDVYALDVNCWATLSFVYEISNA